MKRVISVVATLLASVIAVQAQNTSGILLNRDIVPASSLVTFAQRDYAGTARSMGLGGAMTSLGADMSSFGINPAGFGMYQTNDVSITFGVDAACARNYNAYTSFSTKNNHVNLAINNVGASFKVYESSGALTAINFAFGYNKVADYNFDMSYESPMTTSSLADAFADIANAGGLGINSSNRITDKNGYYDYDMNPYYWGTAMAYKAGLINMDGTGFWYPDEIAPGARVSQYTNLKSRGSAGEVSFALGFNIGNILYLGASLDIQSISRKQSIYYDEYIGYADGQRPSGTDYPYQLQQFDFTQSTYINGSGIGAKFGLVLRPVGGLRLGFAVHTPTYYSIGYRYSAKLGSQALSAGSNPYGWEVVNGYVYADEATPILQDAGNQRWEFTTPTRLLAGISYTFGKYVILSADYEYDTYKSLKMNYAPTNTGYNNADFRNNLQNAHTFRAGLEAKIVPWLALRVGGGYQTDIVKRGFDGVVFSEPIANQSWYASAGIGFRIGEGVMIDLAYRYLDTEYTNYYSFFTQLGDIPNCSPEYGLDMIKHNTSLTFSFRF